MPTIVYGHARDSTGESRNFGDYARRRCGLINRRFAGVRDRRTILSTTIDERALIHGWRCFIARKDARYNVRAISILVR